MNSLREPSSPVPAVSPAPAIADSAEQKETIYALQYKRGGALTTIHFRGNFPIDVAIEKGRIFCSRRGFFFIYVHEWLKDIDQMSSERSDASQTLR